MPVIGVHLADHLALQIGQPLSTGKQVPLDSRWDHREALDETIHLGFGNCSDDEDNMLHPLELQITRKRAVAIPPDRVVSPKRGFWEESTLLVYPEFLQHTALDDSVGVLECRLAVAYIVWFCYTLVRS